MKKRLKILIGLLVLFLMSLPILLYKVDYSVRSINQNSAVYLFKSIDFGNLSQIESDYLTFGWDVIDTFSSKSSKNSMTRDQRIQFLGENKKLADAFGYGLYDAIIIGILETALNPHKIHELYGEIGMFGHWYGTARSFYYEAESRMPARLWNMVKFNFQKREDLLDPANALKMTYIFLWKNYNRYKGDELWSISSYRWGRFVDSHYTDGDSLFPERFIIKTRFGTQRFNPRAYYWTWRNMKLCFEKHDLAVGIYEGWKKKHDKLTAEQIEFRRLYSAFKSQEKQLKELKQLKIILEKKISDYEKSEEHKVKVINQIAGEMKKEGIRKHWHKIKNKCREWQKFLLKR